MEQGNEPCLTSADAAAPVGDVGEDDNNLYRAVFGASPTPSIVYTYDAIVHGDISPVDSMLA
jgi:hypothetical protein